MQESVLIIADDFTGANDTGAQFQKLGLSTISTTKKADVPDLLARNDVVSVNTDTRTQEPKKAYKKVYSLCEEVRDVLDETLIYKKVDSTLRGNIREEIRAVKESLKPDLIVFTPAFPKQDRRTENGIHKIDGTPVHRTDFGSDLKNPVKTSEIPSYFSQFEGTYRHLSPEEVKENDFEKILSKCDLVSFDVDKDEDLGNIVHEISERNPGEVIWIGSAGLAEYVGYDFVEKKESDKSVLLAIGSPNDLTRHQLENYMKRNSAELATVKIESLIHDYQREEERVLKRISETLEKSADPIITISYEKDQIREGRRLADKMEIGIEGFSSILNEKFGNLVRSVMNNTNQGKISGIITSGGDISQAIFEEMQIYSPEIVGEIEPGIPLLRFNGQEIVTKAGGFGSRNLFLKASARLKGGTKIGSR